MKVGCQTAAYRFARDSLNVAVNADILLSDFYAKNISNPLSTGLRPAKPCQSCRSGTPTWSVEGWGGLSSWKSVGYIPADELDPYGVGPFTRFISRTVEYVYNYYCISLLSQSPPSTTRKTQKHIRCPPNELVQHMATQPKF